jgi:hypothetical protein
VSLMSDVIVVSFSCDLTGYICSKIMMFFMLDMCWGLVLKCYELRTRQHKMLNINVLRPLKHYFLKDLMNFGRRL